MEERPRGYHEALDQRAKEVLERVARNTDLLDAISEGLEARRRGERGIPFRAIQEEARRRNAGT